LAEVRRQGYAFLPGHLHPDATGSAVPIRDPAGKVAAALAVVVPNDTIARSRIAVLQAASAAVSRAIEYAAPPSRNF
jgi:DNA-binding IclR family transcriptional regulator